jgi:hypothetical protein
MVFTVDNVDQLMVEPGALTGNEVREIPPAEEDTIFQRPLYISIESHSQNAPLLFELQGDNC